MEPLHPPFVHLPLALSMILPLLGVTLTFSWWRGWLPRRVWLIVAILHAALTVSAFAAMQTGETDERIAQQAVSKDAIHEHEEAAELFLWSTVVALFLALIAAVAEEEKVALRSAVGATLVTIGSLYLAIETGDLGGKLVYQNGAARAFIPIEHGGLADPSQDQEVKTDRDQ